MVSLNQQLYYQVILKLINKKLMKLRLSNVDPEWSKIVMGGLKESMGFVINEIDSGKNPRTQQLNYSLFSNARDLGLIYYAVGFDIVEVKDMFETAFKAIYKVFQLKGTMMGIPVAEISENTKKEDIVFSSEQIDHSLTNFEDGLIGIYLGLITQDLEQVKDLVNLIFAQSIKENTDDFSDPNYELIINSLKYYFDNEPKLLKIELAKITTKKYFEIQKELILLLAEENEKEFNEKLKEFFSWDAKKLQRKGNGKKSSCFLNFASVGLLRLGLDHELVEKKAIENDILMLLKN